ncbi:MAG: outer membrane beta-barrel protein [candidate division Zixibacteria bacterium]|nr:outer membrane beta-barrel protein [candidate division Zixibacteria bacterium]
MKKLGVMLAVMVFCLSSIAPAQETDLSGLFDVSVFGALDIPTGVTQADLTDGGLYRKTGFGFGAAGEYFFTTNVGAGLDFMYNTFSAKDVMSVEMNDKFTAIMIGAHLKAGYPLEGGIIPYASAGGGVALTEWKDVLSEVGPDEVTIDIDPAFYINGNLGVMYFVSPMISVFGEASGYYLMTENTSTEAEYEGDGFSGEFGVNLKWLAFKAGINIWFGMAE